MYISLQYGRLSNKWRNGLYPWWRTDCPAALFSWRWSHLQVSAVQWVPLPAVILCVCNGRPHYRSEQQSVRDGLTAEELCSMGDGITYKWVIWPLYLRDHLLVSSRDTNVPAVYSVCLGSLLLRDNQKILLSIAGGGDFNRNLCHMLYYLGWARIYLYIIICMIDLYSNQAQIKGVS